MSRLIQCLCPERHAITEFSFKEIPDAHAVEITRLVIGELLEQDELIDHCALCGAKSEVWFCEAVPLMVECAA